MDKQIHIDFGKQTERVIHLQGNSLQVQIESNKEKQTSVPDETLQICNFFKKYKNCKFGKDCRNLHVNNHFEEKTESTEDITLKSTKPRTCRFFFQGGCKLGDKCSYVHYRSVSDAGQPDESSHNDAAENVGDNSDDDVIIEDDDDDDNDQFLEHYVDPHYVDPQNDQENISKTILIKEESLERMYQDEKKSSEEKKFSSKQCRFFVSDVGCKDGNNCRFSHTLHVEPGSDKMKTKKSVCKYFLMEKGCRKKNCPFLHEADVPKVLDEDGSTVDETLVIQEIQKNDQSNTKGSVIARKPKGNILCGNVGSEKGCRNKRCPYFHPPVSNDAEPQPNNDANMLEKSNGNQGFTNDSKSMLESKNNNTAKREIKEKEKVGEIVKQLLNDEDVRKTQKTKKAPTSETLCKFFLSKDGCTKRNCRFRHDDSQSMISSDIIHENNTVNKGSRSSQDEKDDSKSLLSETTGSAVEDNAGKCRFFSMPKGCFKGEKCPFKHEESEKTLNKNSSDMQVLKQREFNQLEKRFKSSQGDRFTLVQEQPRIYLIIVSPTDPDWAFVIKDFTFQITFPENYPEKILQVTLLDDKDYPDGFQGFFNGQLLEWINERENNRDKNDLAFRPFLKWFDRNAKQIFIKAATMVKAKQDAELAGIKLVHHKNILQNHKPENQDQTNHASKAQNADASKEFSELNIDDTNDVMEAHGGQLTNSSNALSTKVKKGVEMKFTHMQLSENIGTIKLRNIVLMIQCNRCKTRADVRLPDTKLSNITCQKCHSIQSVTFYSELMHQYSPVVGYLQMEGCRAFDLILQDSALILNCLECSRDNILDGVSYGGKRDHWCHKCHTKMELSIQTVKFNQPQGTAGSVTAKKKDDGSKKKSVKDPSIKDGEPLPSDGTCKHYKKSYRWLRFPCCGKVFPCDICHEEGVENDHDMKFATRMICGFCAKEQPFSKEKPCIRCNSNVTRSKSTHWEGGKGCRDQSKMARGDNKKTTGVNKTISRKKQQEEEKKKKK